MPPPRFPRTGVWVRLPIGAVMEQFGQVVRVEDTSTIAYFLPAGGFLLTTECYVPLAESRRWLVRPHRRTAYVTCAASSGNYRFHREILKPRTGELVDHKNGVGWDNTPANLRLADNYQNAANARKQTRVRFKGVTYCQRKRLYRARIMFRGKSISLGRHKLAEACAALYDQAARKYHGEFAVLNFPEERT